MPAKLKIEKRGDAITAGHIFGGEPSNDYFINI
jgi:hypothetical protein